MSTAPEVITGNQSDENITLSQNQLETLHENLAEHDQAKDTQGSFKKSKSKNNSMLRRSKNSSNFKKTSDS